MIRNWFFKWLNNGAVLASALPEETMCAVPKCTHKATEQWLPSFCALREAGIEIDWVLVCDFHDLAINENAVRELFGDKYEAELKAYRNRRMPELI